MVRFILGSFAEARHQVEMNTGRQQKKISVAETD